MAGSARSIWRQRGCTLSGSSLWEFGEPDWAHTRFFVMFGVAEDREFNPIKIALSGLRRRGAKFVSVNPVRTGYSAIADEWIGIRPGTDGLFVLALVHELLKGDKVDLDYLGSLHQRRLAGNPAAGRARSRLLRPRRAGGRSCWSLLERSRAAWRRVARPVL